jgi:hypothetical protein
MNEYKTPATPNVVTTASGIVRRVSWGAILAGVVVALVLQLLLGVLGIGIGAAVLDPAAASPLEGFGIGAAVWLTLTTVIALFAGGWVAGHLSGAPRGTESILHGVVAWALALLLTFSAAGAFIGGTLGALGRTLETAAQLAPEIIEPAGAQPGRGTQWENIRQEAQGMVVELQGQQQLLPALERLLTQPESATAQDREAVISALAQNTEMSRDEAAATVARWEQNVRQPLGGVDTREVAETVATGTAGAAIGIFVIALLGALAAGLGGLVSRPRDTVVYREEVQPV